MGVQPTTERGRRTRQRIVAAATQVVAEKGALGASLDEVGARATASRSSGIPGMGGYWLLPFSTASAAAWRMASGPGSSGNP